MERRRRLCWPGQRNGKVGQKQGAGQGRGRGFSFYFSHARYFAEVVDTTIIDGAMIRVDKVWVAADLGNQVINPLNALHQVQGSVIDGLAQAMIRQMIDLIAGAPLEIAVEFVKSDFPPTGLGEPVLPPVFPALANALYAATGQRQRSLPLKAVADA